jgi:hypothetical protein
MNLLELFITPLEFFAFEPFYCGVVALTFTLPIFIKKYSVPRKFGLGIAALIWWAFTWIEATTPITSNIRADLALFGSIYMLAAIVGIGLLIPKKSSITEPN